MKNRPVVVPSIGHSVDVRAVLKQQQNRVNAAIGPDGAHQRRDSGPIPCLGVCTELQQQLQTLHVGGQVDFRTKEVSLVRIGATFQQQSGDLVVTIPQRQPQRFIAQCRPRIWIVRGLPVVNLTARVQQLLG